MKGSRVASLPHREEPVEVVWEFGYDASWTPPWRGPSDMSSREEALVHRKHWRDRMSQLAWESLGIPLKRLEEAG